jgi:excisionase family DNA binding protein
MTPQTDTRPMLTVRDVANRLSLKERTVRELLGSGQLPSVKIGGARRVEPAALERFIAARRGAA